MKIKLVLLFVLAYCLTSHAQILVKQSTATTVNFKLTKIADGTDDTGATVTSITLKIVKHSDTSSSSVTSVSCAASGSSNDCVHVAAGLYNAELTASNTDTLGRLDVCAVISADYTDCTRYEVLSPIAYTMVVNGGSITGTAQSATGTTIVLASASAFSDDELNGGIIEITGGTGVGQFRQIDDYVGSTDTATVTTWTTNPDSTSTYRITPMFVLQTASSVSSAVWAETTRQLTGSQTFNITGNLSGTVGSVTGAVGSVGSGGITAASLAADAITAAKIASDVTTELQTGLYQLQKNTATATDRISFFAYDTSGALTKTASAVTCQISKDGGTPATVTDAPVEVEFTAGAIWKFGLTQAETNANYAALVCTGTGLADTPLLIEFQH